MIVTSIAEMDEYDPVSSKTREGYHLLRYIFGTECGEIYLIGFDLRKLILMSPMMTANEFEAGKFITIEYLGGKLPNCSSIACLGGGYIYFGSRFGDSHILKLQEENTGNKDRPYFTIERTYACLGNI
jgi:hypothetical protein